MRGLLGEQLLASRPYRLTGRVTTDWTAVEAQLAAGDLRSAVRGYRGPLPPRSSAPGIERPRRPRGRASAGARALPPGRPDGRVDPVGVGT